MAKSLATGHGYHLISLPNEPIQTKSPPFYPFLLSLIWRMNPNFPANIPAMMLSSILATLLSVVLCWLYLTRQGYASKGQALLIVAIMAINSRTIILGTGIYPEMFYTALSIAALHLTEEYEKQKQGWVTGAGLGIVMGLAFLTRTAGVTLLVAVVLYFLMRNRMRMALLPLSLAACFVLAWFAWSYFNRPEAIGANTAYYESYFQTLKNVINDAQERSHESKLMTILSIAGKNSLLLIVVSIPIVCLGLSYDLPQQLPPYLLGPALLLGLFAFAFTVAGFVRHRAKGTRLLHIYVVVYLAVHLMWPYGVYDRFLMPLLPFLLLFLITELKTLLALVRKEWRSGSRVAGRISAAFLGLVLLMMLGLALSAYCRGITDLLFSSKQKAAGRAAEDAQAVQWINENTAPSDVLVCYRDPLYYLYTGRKGTWAAPLQEGALYQSLGGGQDLDEQANVILRIINENNARYLVLTSSDLDLNYTGLLYRGVYKELVERHQEAFVLVFESEDKRSFIYRIESGSLSTR
jgi:4-amino-4-deoxy-L-arabinose transferase-like glycosyltransferase